MTRNTFPMISDASPDSCRALVDQSSWLILRTSGGRTIPLVRSLAKAGITAWAPVAQHRKRRPRSNKYREYTAAVLPTFVFAPAADLGRLLAIVHAPVSDHPPFTVFQAGAGFPTIRDRDLQSLRDAEARMQAEWNGRLEAAARTSRRHRNKSIARAYAMGERVRINAPAFAGLTGEIVNIDGGYLALELGGLLSTIQIAACDVVKVQVDSALSEQDRVA
jgi:hypothetical protein